MFCHLASGQTLKAIYNDGMVGSFSISDTSVVHYMIPRLQPEGIVVPTISGFCKSPLLSSCFRAQQQNNTKFYTPVDAASVLLLECITQPGQVTLLGSLETFEQCNPNDFVIASDKLLVACRPLGSNDACTYLYDGQCQNFPPPHNIENLITDPVVLAVTNMEDSSGGRIVSVGSGVPNLKLIVFLASDQRRGPYNIPADCQAPVKLSRQESTILLTCVNSTKYMVNVTELPAAFFRINSATHGSLLALSSKGYALFSSPLQQLTLQNITSRYAVSILINASHGNPVFADFTPNGDYAFVATNVTVIFIHVTEALTGRNVDGYFHFIPVQLCFVCPSVQFINSTVAIVSGRDGDRHTTILQFIALDQWPPYLLLNRSRMLPDFPKQYLFVTDSSPKILTVSPTTSNVIMISSSRRTSTVTTMSVELKPTFINSDVDSDNATVIAIVIPIVICLIVFSLCVVAAVAISRWRNKLGVNGSPVQEQNRNSNVGYRYNKYNLLYIIYY